MVDFLFAFIRLLRYLLPFWSYEPKCVQLGCFQSRVDLFAVKSYLDRVAPTNHSWRQKTRDTGLPMAKTVTLRSLSLTQYLSVTNRRTDRQTDMPPV